MQHILPLNDSRVRWDTVAVDPIRSGDESVLVRLTDGDFSAGDHNASASARVVYNEDYEVVGLVIDPTSVVTGAEAWTDDEVGIREAHEAVGYYLTLPQPAIEVTIGH